MANDKNVICSGRAANKSKVTVITTLTNKQFDTLFFCYILLALAFFVANMFDLWFVMVIAAQVFGVAWIIVTKGKIFL